MPRLILIEESQVDETFWRIRMGAAGRFVSLDCPHNLVKCVRGIDFLSYLMVRLRSAEYVD